MQNNLFNNDGAPLTAAQKQGILAALGLLSEIDEQTSLVETVAELVRAVKVVNVTLTEPATTLDDTAISALVDDELKLVLYITTTAGQTLTFSCVVPTNSQISNPITLEDGVYIAQFQYFLSQWNLVSFVGAYQTPS